MKICLFFIFFSRRTHLKWALLFVSYYKFFNWCAGFFNWYKAFQQVDIVDYNCKNRVHNFWSKKSLFIEEKFCKRKKMKNPNRKCRCTYPDVEGSRASFDSSIDIVGISLFTLNLGSESKHTCVSYNLDFNYSIRSSRRWVWLMLL